MELVILASCVLLRNLNSRESDLRQSQGCNQGSWSNGPIEKLLLRNGSFVFAGYGVQRVRAKPVLRPPWRSERVLHREGRASRSTPLGHNENSFVPMQNTVTFRGNLAAKPATPGASLSTQGSTAEREGISKKNFCLENCSSQGQNLALTVLYVLNLYVLNSLESGAPESGRLLTARWGRPR